MNNISMLLFWFMKDVEYVRKQTYLVRKEVRKGKQEVRRERMLVRRENQKFGEKTIGENN